VRTAWLWILLGSAALAWAPPAPLDTERLDPRLDALVPPGAVLEKVVDGMDWTEGPLWDSRDASLLFSDVPRNSVLRWRAGAGVDVFLRSAPGALSRTRAPGCVRRTEFRTE
jgi:gluconolactonase